MGKLNIKNLKYEEKKVKIILAVIAFIFLFSFLVFAIKSRGKRYIFYFESADSGKISMEYRYLPRKSYPENVLLYTDELLLGPKTERFKQLFSTGTYVVSQFVRDDVLYINLSGEVLDMAGSCSDIKTGIELFKKNILNTFGKINSVEMYIDNKSIYTQEE